MVDPTKYLRDAPPMSRREHRCERRVERAEGRYFRALRRADRKVQDWEFKQLRNEVIAAVQHTRVRG